MTAITAFRQNLFQPISKDSLQNLNKAGSTHYYCVVGDQLGIEEKKGDGSTPGLKDLKAISAFVQGAIANKAGFDKELEGHSENERIYFYINLGNLSSLMVQHNEKVRDSSLVTFVHVLLLILTLGLFKYRDTLLIEKLTVSLKDLGINAQQVPDNSELYQLSVGFVLGMKKEDRDLFLEKAGLMGKWTAFLEKRPYLTDSDLASNRIDQGLFRPLRLDVLRQAENFEKTPLAMFPTQKRRDSGEHLQVMFETIEVFVVYLKSMSPTERRDTISCFPKQQRDDMVEISKAVQSLEESRSVEDKASSQKPPTPLETILAQMPKERVQSIVEFAKMVESE